MAYTTYNNDNTKVAEEIKIEHRVYFDEEKADISALTALPPERLHAMRMESEIEEWAIFDNLRETAREWEKQAGNTLLLNKAMEYIRTPPVQHTANEWDKTDSGRTTMSNMVYKFSYYVNESSHNSFYVTWSVRTNSPERVVGTKIAGQDRKAYDNRADMEKYLAGRIKAYSNLFTEISPPIPPKLAKHFQVNGQLLPGYTIEGEEPKTPPERAADIGGVSVSEPERDEPPTEAPPAEQPEKISIENGDMLVNTARQSFDIQEIHNRRFMFNPETGTLILGRQYAGNEIISSHTEEHSNMNTGEPFDDFIRGWIGTSRGYNDGVIHFAPNIPKDHPAMFDKGFSTLEMFLKNGANENTLIRGFPGAWEQELSNIISTQNEPRKERENMNDPISIKISNPENTESAWLRLPATAEQFSIAVERIGAQEGKFIISEVEPGIHLSADCANGATVEQLNHLAAIIEDYDDKQVAKLNAVIGIMPDPESISSIIGHAHNINFHDHYPDINTHAELGEHVFTQSGLIQIPEEWAGAVDREKLGQLAAENENGIFTEQGYIVENGIAWEDVPEIPQDYQLTPQIDYDTISTRTPAVAAATPPTHQQTAAATRPPVQQTPATPAADPAKAQTATTAAAVVTAAPFVLKADNPRDKMKEITDRLETGIKGIFESEQYKTYLNTLSKFHNYSFNNCLLIAMQKPTATHVAGFNAWKKDFKRSVIKGEKGLKIIAPAPFKTKKMVDAVDASGKPVFKDGKRVKEEKEITVPAFTVATVFDVSQTEGEPLPELGVNELTGSVDRYKEFIAAVEKASPVPVNFEKIPTGAKGYFHIEEKRIAINEGMGELQTLKTLIHEVAHARIHDIDKNAPKDQPRPDRRTREVEAESIAYTVCQHYGLDTSDYSFGYVAGWSGNKQLDTLKSSLDTIRKEAAAIITEIDKNFAELTKGKEQTAEQTTPELKGDTFTIYQLKSGEEMRGIRFEPLDSLKTPPDIANYDTAYTATLEKGTTLEKIFTDFNLNRPEGFTGHSLSLSDVVVMNRDGKETAYYVDKAGFKELPDFLTPKEQAQEKAAEPKGNQLWQNYTAITEQYPDSIVFNKVGDFYEVMGDKASIAANQLGLAITGRDVGLPERVPLVGVPAHNFDKVVGELVKNNYKVAIAEKLNVTERHPQPTPAVDLKTVADYFQKQNTAIQAADPNKVQGQAAFSMAIKRLEQANERIPDTQPMLKALLTNAAQSTDLPMLKERMNTLHTEFIQHYATAVQMTIDTSGKAEPPAPAPSVRQNEPAPTTKDPTPPRGENVAAIEAKVNAGETINLSDLSDAIKKDKQAAQAAPRSSTTKRGTQSTAKKGAWKAAQSQDAWDRAQGKGTSAKTEKPSIKEEIAAGKKQLAGQKSTPAKTAAKNKNNGLGD